MKNINFEQRASIKPLDSGITENDVEKRSYLSYVKECCDLLMKYGTDRYGEKKQPLLVTILDVRDRTCPQSPPPSITNSYNKPFFYRHLGPGRPALFPTPYRNWHPGSLADFSWGIHQSYIWESLQTDGNYEVKQDDYNRIEFEKYKASALCIEITPQSEKGCGIYDLKINGSRPQMIRKAGTYHIKGHKYQNSTYEAQQIENKQEFLEKLSETSPLQKIEDMETVPVFLWEGWDVTERKSETITEWLMYEFEEPLDINSLEVYWLDNGQEFRVPDSWRVLATNSKDESCVNYPEVDVVPWRGEKRLFYWKPGSSDFYEDQATYQSLNLLGQISGDKKYSDFIQNSLKCAMQITDSKGMFWWGGHRCYDVFKDKINRPTDWYEEPHETAIKYPQWETLWSVDKEATRREIDGIWEWHVIDKKTGEHNRHNDGERGVPFSMNGGLFANAFCFLYTKTGEKKYLGYAELLADYHWDLRDKNTNLTPEVAYREEVFQGKEKGLSMLTTCHEVVGLLTYYLIKSYELTGKEKFLNQAMAYLKGYARNAYDQETGKFYGGVYIADGTVVKGNRSTEQNIPIGFVDLWQPYQYGSEFPLNAAQIYAYAYTVTGDEEMLDTARKWAEFIKNDPPENGCQTDSWYELYARLFSKYGTFAGYYGRTISFYINMYANTGEEDYLNEARSMARKAISKLYYQGLFRGHPARPYYCNVDDVGNLLYALIQLDRVMELGEKVVGKKIIPLGENSKEVIGFDNW